MTNPYLYGFLTIGILYILSRVYTGSWLPWALARGHNQETSTSQLQFLIFTAVVVFAYATVLAWRVIHAGPGQPLTLPEIPTNLLLLMGFSITTAAGSKGITVSYLARGEISEDDQSTAVQNRDGSTDLVKVQMLMWTLVAAVFYLITFVRFIAGTGTPNIQDSTTALPDIDSVLLVLMGISQGGYLGNKLVGRTGGLPKLTNILPTLAIQGDDIVLQGMQFGPSAAGNDIIFFAPDGKESLAPTDGIEWSDTRIKFALPDKYVPPDSTNVAYQVKVRTNGVSSRSKELQVRKAIALDLELLALEELAPRTHAN